MDTFGINELGDSLNSARIIKEERKVSFLSVESGMGHR